MFPDAVVDVLLADNPWIEGDDAGRWIDKHIPSNYLERVQEIVLDERIALLIGPRQSGKSTLIWKTVSSQDEPCLLVNCEEPSIRSWAESPALFLQGLAKLVPPRTVVFFEEVQHLEDAGLFLKGLVDRKAGYRFVATDSSSFELESKTRESLAGRANRYLVLPFSSEEVFSAGKGPEALAFRRKKKIIEDLVVYGGYPAVTLGDKKEATLTGLLESFILRDASDRFRIRHTDAFRTLMQLMASQVGNLCNYSDWASNAGVSVDTIKDYTAILVDAHVVKLVRPFVGGKRAEITSTAKVYFVDNGIRNRLFGGFADFRKRADKGSLFENHIFCELLKNLNPLTESLRYWRSKSGAEVDFVVERRGEMVAIDVKAGRSHGKLTRSAHSFINAYAPKRFVVVSEESYKGFTTNETEVVFVTANDFLQYID